MDRSARRFLEDLLHTPGPSGYEGEVQDIWRSYVTKVTGKVERDVHGSQHAAVRGRSDRPLLLVAHADEVGLIVQYIDDDGYIFVRAIGGIDVSILPSHRVTIVGRKGHVRGVIGKRAYHLREKNGDEKPPRLEDLHIDIGASSRSEAMGLVEIGDPIVFGGDFETLAGDFASARNFDNRSGLFVVAEVLRALASSRKKPGFTVHGLSSVQEETGLLGSGNLAQKLHPAAAIIVDVTHDTRNPGVKVQKHGDVRCGAGPVLTRGVRISKPLFEAIRAIAGRARIKVQLEIDSGSTHTDADPISSRLEGVPVGIVSIPCRYMHSSCEMIDLKDLEKTVELLAAVSLGLDPAMDFTLRG
jgi:putative aminopeptidase FrvX